MVLSSPKVKKVLFQKRLSLCFVKCAFFKKCFLVFQEGKFQARKIKNKPL